MSALSEKYRTPYACVVDLEIMMDCSHRTAERMMARIKRHYNIKRYQKVTIEQVKQYLIKQ